MQPEINQVLVTQCARFLIKAASSIKANFAERFLCTARCFKALKRQLQQQKEWYSKGGVARGRHVVADSRVQGDAEVLPKRRRRRDERNNNTNQFHAEFNSGGVRVPRGSANNNS